jgi:predicted nucleic acid-binding protein
LFKDFPGRLLTTEPILTETVYLLGPSLKAPKTAIEFILNGGATLVPQSSASLSKSLTFMEKYRDIPMDFADATLVVLAEETGVQEIFTLDNGGFRTYRIRGKKTFTVWPN